MKKYIFIFLFPVVCQATIVTPSLNSFNAGEVSPLLEARSDFTKYNNSCRLLRNMFVLSQGPVTRRPGTKYIAEVKDSSKEVRLIPFEYAKTDTYTLEFGDEYIRFYRNGGQIVEGVGTEDLSSLNNIVAHWLLNEEEGTTVVDDDGATHDGTASADCSTLREDGKVGTGCFDLDGQYTVEITDHADFSFTDNTDDKPFSFACWAFVTEQSGIQVLLSKWRDDSTEREWRFSINNERTLQLHLADTSADLSGNGIAQWKLNDDAANTNVISSGPTYTIDDADAVANTFTISDDGDLTASFPDGSEFTVEGSTGNDGQYVVVGTAYGAPDFVITVAAIADGTDDGTIAPHAGVATANTDTFNATGKISGALDFGGSKAVEIDDSADFSFGNGTVDSPFSIVAWIYVTTSASTQMILTKFDTNAKGEWTFRVGSDEKLRMTLRDESAGVNITRYTDDALSAGWHFVVATYAGQSVAGATAADLITLYVDSVLVNSTSINDDAYNAMEDLGSKVAIGAYYLNGSLDLYFQDKIDNVVMFDIELTQADVSSLWNDGNGTELMAAVEISAVSNSPLSLGWHYLACTYSAPATNEANGIILYEDGAAITSTKTNDANYGAMQGGDEDIWIGSQRNLGDSTNEYFLKEKIDEVSIFSDVITPTEIASLYSISVYELATSFTETELFDIQYIQSADTMYLVHPDHEPCNLTRMGHTIWTIADVNYIDGPFLNENTDTSITVTPSATTGTIILDSNSDIFSANLVGALWEIKHPRTNATLSGSLATDSNSAPIACEGDYKFTTHGTWTATVYLERSLDGSTWEIVSGSLINSIDDDNISYSGNESDSGYTYQVTMASRTSGTCTYNFVVFEHLHTGVVRIASYVDPNEVTATVHTTLGGTTATYYWSEGYWSPKNGYPATIEFHEFRLFYGGNANYPQTIWASKSGDETDYESMSFGTDADDALIYTLPGQNPIQFLHSYDYLIVGTLGGVGRLGDIDEPMSAETSPQYRQQTPYGSEFIPAVSAGDAVLYVGYGGDKVREFAYSLERDRFISPDMTVLAEHITGDGIVDVAYQIRPDSVLWCVLDDGDMATMTYQKEHDVFAWSLQITEGDFESVTIIPGSEEDEIWTIVNRTVDSNTVRYVEQFQTRDWGTDNTDAWFVDCGLDWDGGDAVSISDANETNPCVITVSTWPTDGDGDNLADGDQIKILAVAGMTELNGNIYTMDDADVSAKTFTLNDSDDSADIDSTGYTTYSSGGTVQRFEKDFSNLGHVEGEAVSVFADGEARSNNTVSSGAIETSNWYNKVLVGLPYTSIMETMPLVFNAQSGSTSANYTKVINVSFDFYETLGLSFGVDEDNLTTKDFDMFTGWKEYRFTYGKMRPSTIYVQTAKPVPLTIRQIVPTVEIRD